MRAFRASGIAAAVAVLAVGALAPGCAMKTHVHTVTAAVVNGEIGFKPAVVRAKRADKVEFRVGNTTQKTHGFSVDGYGVAETVDPGKTITVDLRATRRGTFRIYCQLHTKHRAVELRVL